jgi:type VI secretion system secreted protein Hcp
MSVEMFLKLTGCNGEAIATGHEQEIELLDWRWGFTNKGTAHSGGGAGTGKADFENLTVTKFVDLASTTLMLNCAKGKHFKEGKITARKVGGDTPLEYITITMTEVFISGVHHGGSMGDERTTENVTLNFEKVKIEYKPQTETGSGGGDTPFDWDIRKNEAA